VRVNRDDGARVPSEVIERITEATMAPLRQLRQEVRHDQREPDEGEHGP
jgi:hypothetical protein